MSEGIVERYPATSLFTPWNHKKGRKKLVLTSTEIPTMLEVLDIREELIARSPSWRECAQMKFSACNGKTSTKIAFRFDAEP
jgi:hypothetical protein